MNPNDREDGWINATLDLTGKYSGSSEAGKNRWLTYGAENDGVGGYIPQLRYSTSDSRIVDAARAAAPSETLPAESKKDAICFVVTAVDLLGNESARPKAGADCKTAEEYGVLVEALSKMPRKLVEGMAEADVSEALRDAITEAEAAIFKVGLKGGVDTTAPTAEFARSGLDEDSREIDDEFEVIVEDNSGGSAINLENPLVASLEVRDAKATKMRHGGRSADQCKPLRGAV